MPSVPRIVRAIPKGAITRPDPGIPIIARIRWHNGEEQETAATATAWTRDAVQISWEVDAGEGLRSDWIPAVDVRRYGVKPKPVNVPPHTIAGKPRARW